MNDLESRCQLIVARLTALEGWPLAADDRSALAHTATRYLPATATDAEIETVVRNYYQDGPLHELMQQRHRESEDYWNFYRREFVKLAVRRGVDFAECEDVANEAIGQALKAFSQFAFRGSLNAWLYRIATNACYDWHKYRKLRSAINSPLPTTDDASEEAAQSPPAPSSERPDESLLHYERRLILETTFERLLTDRDLVILHYTFIETEYLDDQTGQPRPWTDANIARLVGLAPASIPTIRGRIVRRLARDPEFKEIMTELLGPGWFKGRARPVRKMRRDKSDQGGQGE